MPNESHYRKLENMYLSAPTNAYYQPKITISEARAEIEIDVRPEFFHAAGAAHGSLYFKVADDAAFFAVNSLNDQAFVLTTNLNLILLRPVSEGIIHGVATVIAASPKIYHAESLLTDSEGREVGRATASFVPSKMRLTSDIGYRIED